MTEQDKNEIHMRLTQLEMEMKANTRMTTGLQDDVTTLLDILGAVKSGLRVLGVLGGVVRWTAGIATAVGALWAAFHQSGPK